MNVDREQTAPEGVWSADQGLYSALLVKEKYLKKKSMFFCFFLRGEVYDSL